MKSVIIWGATGQAQVLREALPSSGFSIVALFDNRELSSPFPDVPIYKGRDGFTTWLNRERPAGDLYACVAIGGGRGRDRLEIQRWLSSEGVEPLTVVHHRAFVASDVEIGPGAQILAMSAVCTAVRLGEAVIINTSASVDHGCLLGDGVHIAPGARIAGEVQIDDHAFIGTGAVVLPRIKIGRGAIIGAGAVVTRDVAQGHTVIGMPARPVR